jgi:hypothetical protein
MIDLSALTDLSEFVMSHWPHADLRAIGPYEQS